MKKLFSVRLPSLVAVLLGISLLTAQTITHATTIIHTPFAQMCREADAIVEGTVASKNPRLIPGSGGFPGMIVTDVVLTNLTVIKGERTDPFTISLPGGTVGTMRMSAPGTPQVEVGEKIILFLNSNNTIMGVWEGAFKVREQVLPIPQATVLENASGELVAREFDDSTGELNFYTTQESLSKPVLLMSRDQFHRLIRNLLPQGGGKGEISE